ncbi:unnamed protein product [Phyllotreta striolata]|uniref:Carbohydrate kinase PfkB domain-containing protein n=1 Tax=Phyllotreta striolata TaxID=444603 RepID=A0A9N9TV73_PHYSR|nr:unnamed protein product [Phyllotreta striolata]
MDMGSNSSLYNEQLDGRMYKTQFSFTPGGVGRNMCEAMHKLGCSPDFLTVIGDDYFGDQVKSSIPAASRRLMRTSNGKGTAQCKIVFDKVGNCQMLMGDMDVHGEITPQIVADNEDVIKKSPLVVLEANLSLDAINSVLQVADKHGIPGE